MLRSRGDTPRSAHGAWPGPNIFSSPPNRVADQAEGPQYVARDASD